MVHCYFFFIQCYVEMDGKRKSCTTEDHHHHHYHIFFLPFVSVLPHRNLHNKYGLVWRVFLHKRNNKKKTNIQIHVVMFSPVHNFQAFPQIGV